MSKSFSEIDLVPGTVGLAVGVADGMVSKHISTKHRNTYFRAAVAAAGVVGQRVGWSEDINIGLMCAAAALAAQSLPGGIRDHNSGEAFPAVHERVVPGSPSGGITASPDHMRVVPGSPSGGFAASPALVPNHPVPSPTFPHGHDNKLPGRVVPGGTFYPAIVTGLPEPHRIVQNNGPQWRTGTIQPTTVA